MDSTSNDQFMLACNRLEKLSELRANQPSFSSMHSFLVDRFVTAAERTKGDTEAFVQRAITEMADKKAISPGDPALLTRLGEVAFKDFLDGVAVEGYREVIERLTALNELSREVRDTPASSPATKAIVETAEASANQASKECLKTQCSSAKEVGDLWKRLVGPDVKGAFWGGAQGYTVATGMAPLFHLLPIAIPIAAAICVVVGAATESGNAYHQYRTPPAAAQGVIAAARASFPDPTIEIGRSYGEGAVRPVRVLQRRHGFQPRNVQKLDPFSMPVW